MKSPHLRRSLSLLYLILVPLLTIVFGLGIGYISYTIYLPVWLLNVVLMICAAWSSGLSVFRRAKPANQRLIIVAICFILPTLLTSMFFGLGAPPYEDPKQWLASVTEQRARYYFLLAAGLFTVTGFAILGQQLSKAGEDLYSVISLTAIQISAPVFLIDMSFWGFYLTKLYQRMVDAHTTVIPEWALTIRSMFYYVNVFTCSLVYLATAAISISLKRTRVLKSRACDLYCCISVLFGIFSVLPPTLPEPFATLNFIVSIPAVPFMFPYFIGINLLRKAGADER